MVCAIAVGAASWAAANLQESADSAGFTVVDPSRVTLELPAGTEGLPAEWSRIVAYRLSLLGEMTTQDPELGERVAEEMADLPFVIELGEPRVIWPDGVEVPMRLREPVACICIGEDYLPVSSDGVVLPGLRSSPPDYGRGLLPVIGPVDGRFLPYRPGDRLEQERDLDAIAVAISMRAELSPGDLHWLGPVVIDATHSQATAVGEPGTRLRLEDGRSVFFGRSPRANAPGELPAELKWRHLMEAMALLGEEEYGRPKDWDLVDLRWDVPTLRPRLGYR